MLKPDTSGPVAIWDGEPKRTSHEHDSIYEENGRTKIVTVRLPESTAADLECGDKTSRPHKPDAIADLIRAVDGLPEDLSARKKDYLRAADYGRKRHP